MHVYGRARCFPHEIVRFDSQYAIEGRFLFSITAEVSVTKVVEGVNVARVELKCPLQISSRFFPAPLAPLDVSRYSKYPRIVGQCMPCNFQFSQSGLVIKISVIKVIRSREMYFASIWTDAERFLNGCFGCRQPRRSMVEAKKVNLVMTPGELAIGFEKRWIARYSSVQQIDCLQARISAGGTRCWC